jgi:parallel beta-helix repeat protein
LNIISSSNFTDHTQITTILPKSAQSHPKIAIEGNAELDSFPDKSGLGTLADPYIIANYTIDAANSGSGVSIQNIDRYLILQNLTISNSAGYGTGSGIYLNNVTNVQIDSCQTPSNYHGIYLVNSANCTIANNTISDSTYGVRLASSENISLFDNRMIGGGLYLEGDLDSQVSHTSSNNSVNNRLLFWYVNETGLSAANFTSAGQIILVNCTDADISDQNLTAATIGLQLLSTKDSRITNVTANEGVYGFYFDTEARNNTIVNCTTSGNSFYGQFLDSSNTTVINCTAFENNYHGFLLDFPGEFNNIINSKASNNNGNGIRISNSVNNTITNCTTSGNAQYGLEIFSSEFNTIVNCTLSTNTQKGLYLRYSDQNAIINCTISDNFGYGVHLDDSHSNILSNCTSMGNSFYGIYLDKSNSNDILNATISDNTNGGLVLSSSDGNEIGYCKAWNNPYGYYLYDSSYNHISYSTAINNQMHGIYLYSFSQHNTLSNCFIDANTHTGIRIQYAANWNQISNCSASNSQYGLSIDESYYNDITQNDIYDNENGFYLINSAFDNVFWNNWILRNSLNQAEDNSGINQWDHAGTGNYWDDYFDRYPSAIIVDGYWSIPYSLNGSAGAQDNFPLAAASVVPGPPSVLTLNQTIYNSSLLIKWTAVSDTTSYNVYVNGTLNATTSTTQQLVHLGTKGMYEITVTAVNASGESVPSNAIMIIVANPPPVPEPPIILTPEQTIPNTSLLVEWTAVPEATSYNIYVNGTLNATTSITQQLIYLGMNGTYEITVSAVNASGESDPSSAVVIVVAIPLETDPSSTISSYPIEYMLIFAVITSMKLLPRKRKLKKIQN